MAWVYLVIAGGFECVWALLLKYSDGFTRFGPTAGFIIAAFISLFFLSRAMQTIPIGTAYAIWTGTGAVGVSIFGMVVLNESKDMLRLFCLGLIVIGILGLKVTAKQ
ncbi:DMT family transporter [Emcibacter nanhaiensis]|uniref:Guanidinium exporter n=1 Tax=Emcibacter nanhaiensis TaxID=1505037 RepID=A0A501P931_9PROT|nr:multidrug efflux SMR transporter [Emcibacter nanhaiensis]TPD56849.1 multidrug efflux SMR transporter [Emcibacter nanhaiensis]